MGMHGNKAMLPKHKLAHMSEEEVSDVEHSFRNKMDDEAKNMEDSQERIAALPVGYERSREASKLAESERKLNEMKQNEEAVEEYEQGREDEGERAEKEVADNIEVMPDGSAKVPDGKLATMDTGKIEGSQRIR